MDKPIALEAYEEMAATFAARVDWYAWNAHYDRPATLSLLPDVQGKRVLDAGCGPGAYAEWLLEHGAQVVGIDASPTMIDLARVRLGERAELRVASLDQPLAFEQESFDVVLSALTIDYIKNWKKLFSEFFRVLKPGSTLVFSCEHPCADYWLWRANNYFETELIETEWRTYGVHVPTYRRPLQAVLNPLLEAGFALERLLEPQPTEEFEKQEPDDYARLMRRPVFLCVRAGKGRE